MIEKKVLAYLLQQCEDHSANSQDSATIVEKILAVKQIHYVRGPHNMEHLVKRIFENSKISKKEITRALMHFGSLTKRGEYFVNANIIDDAGNLVVQGDKLVVKVSKKLQNDSYRDVDVHLKRPKEMNTKVYVTGLIKTQYDEYYLEPTDARLFGKSILIYPVTEAVRKYADTRQIVCIETRPNAVGQGTIGYGKFVKTIGRVENPGTKIDSLMAEYNYNIEFSEDVENEAKQLPTKVEQADIDQMKKSYGDNFWDWRYLPFATIDPQTCKDMDDAVYCRRLPDGSYNLKVAIAYVANYVDVGSKIFKEALFRGNSTYIGDRVNPMLPPALSNGICSLNPNVDRFTMGGDFIIKDGKVVSAEFNPTVINSRYKMSYENADDMFANKNDSRQTFELVAKSLFPMADMEKCVRPLNEKSGFLHFHTLESTFRLSEDRTDIVKVAMDNETFAHKMVETCMLIYNEELAKYCTNNNIPIIYRVEKQIESENQLKIEEVLRLNRIPVQIGENQDYNDFLNSVIDYAKRQDEHNKSAIRAMYSKEIDESLIDLYPFTHYISNEIIKCVPKAMSSTQNIGHSATHKSTYAHMSSPIRRIVDSINQLQIRAFKLGLPYPFTRLELEQLCAHINKCEEDSTSAERKSDQALATLFAQKTMLGKNVSAVVTKVSKSEVVFKAGMFTISMPLDNNRTTLNTYLTEVTNLHTGESFRLGKVYPVTLEKCDAQTSTIFGKGQPDLARNQEAFKFTVEQFERNEQSL